MNQPTEVNTSPENEQANVVNATFSLSQIKQFLGDIESQALAAKALCEIMYDELDAIDGQGIVNAAVRIDALVKATHRNAVLTQESVQALSLVLLDEEGGAQ
jgi:hypothetical protein